MTMQSGMMSVSARSLRAVKGVLLGSAAGLAVAGGAQAADLPTKKAAPVEYVRICSAYGAGFFYIPGTDTCLRVGGRARFEATYVQPLIRGDNMGYRALGRLNIDARTQTGYGTLRAFVRFELASRTGGFLKSGTQERAANAFSATGVDTAGRVQQYVNADKAFIQFAGLTAGRAASFYDFYAHDYEIIAGTLGSDMSSTNVLAYTATFGEGFSATISMEDPNFRKNPIFGAPTASVGVNPVDVVQRSRMPDFVGALRYDAAWGSAQLSAAVHEINTGNFTSNLLTIPHVPSEYGWAVQGGVKINLPFIAAGDGLYLQGSYGEGATIYTGISNYNGTYSLTGNPIGGLFNTSYADAILDPVTGRLSLSKSFTVVGSFLHYWTPEWRSAIFGSYGEIEFNKTARARTAAAGIGGLTVADAATSALLRDASQIVAGASLIWSPVKDLDIGVEGLYTQVGVKNGRVLDPNRPGSTTATVKDGDTFQVRMRVQRDF
ncbi:porin [Methylobacterium sp. 4-46]|nr:porin [Methylobacterium sp. 4-46]